MHCRSCAVLEERIVSVLSNRTWLFPELTWGHASHRRRAQALPDSGPEELIPNANCCTQTDELMSPIRLFRNAPSGILLTSEMEAVPRKIVHSSSSSSDGESMESLARHKAVVVDGATVQLEAARAAERALRAAEKESIIAEKAAKEEEDRVAFLKEQRGESWLPSATNEMTTWKNKF